MKTLLCFPEEAAIVGYNGSMVLNQIRYWLYKAKNGKNRYVVDRSGQPWLAHSRQQLEEETEFSPKQVRRALEALKLHGYIDVEQHLFHGKNICHFRAAEEGCLAQKGPTKLDEKGPLAAAPGGLPDLAPKGYVLKLETSLKTNEEYGALNAPLDFDHLIRKKKKKKDGEEGSDSETEHGMLSDDQELTPTALGDVFRKAWDDAYEGQFLPVFVAKDLGQFKNIIQSCPAGIAAPVVDHSTRHWHEFCCYAINQQGAFKLPNQPTVAMLLLYVQSAVNLYLEELEQAAKPPKKWMVPKL